MRKALALVFLMLVSASSPPQGGGSREQGKADQAVANSLENVAAAIERGNERESYNPNCEPGSDNRRSDLCAQWKAADAASESASWASWFFWLTVVGTAIGAATLAAAAAAAYFASEAAKHTKAGAGEAKRQADAAADSLEIARAELRACLQTDEQTLKWDSDTGTLTVTFKIRNAGGTTAHSVGTTINASFSARLASRAIGKTLEKYESSPSDLAKGEWWTHALKYTLSTLQHGQLCAGKAEVRIEINASFTDDFGFSWNFYEMLLINADAMRDKQLFTQLSQHTARSKQYVKTRLQEPTLL